MPMCDWSSDVCSSDLQFLFSMRHHTLPCHVGLPCPSYLRQRTWGLPWQSSGYESELPLQGLQVQSVAKTLISRIYTLSTPGWPLGPASGRHLNKCSILSSVVLLEDASPSTATNPGPFFPGSAVAVTSRVSSSQCVSAFARLTLRLLPSLMCAIQPLNTAHTQFSYCLQTGLPTPATL